MQYISKYGYKYIIFFAIIMLIFLNFDIFELFFVSVFIGCVLFFRQRLGVKCTDMAQILVPIDGKILDIGMAEFESENYTRVVIEKSLFGVGVLYAPYQAQSVAFRQRHGLFLCNYIKSSSILNERGLYIFKNNGIKFAMRVIAGAFSRSLELENPKSFIRSDVLGFLGSGRVVLFLPLETKICVSVGERVKSLSTLGYLEKRIINE